MSNKYGLTDVQFQEERLQVTILENAGKWQINKAPLTYLNNIQLDIVYQVGDVIKCNFYANESELNMNVVQDLVGSTVDDSAVPIIGTNCEYIKWLVRLENDVKDENLIWYRNYFHRLLYQLNQCASLFTYTENTIHCLDQLQSKYQQVTTKTDSLHNLSDRLMKKQKQMKDKKQRISEKLYYFVMFGYLYDSIERNSKRINYSEFLTVLDNIDDAVEYLNKNVNYKESTVYRMKYESLLSSALVHVFEYFVLVIVEATKQVTDPENGTNLLNTENCQNDPAIETAFSLYYGKFQNAASKVDIVLRHIEHKINKHSLYKNAMLDCQKTYFAQRSPIISAAVSRALTDLKECHKGDHSVLFRSSCLFIMKVCVDESTCFFYFFNRHSDQLNAYLGMLCQQLYDHLRPNLISINHLEILTELCSILRKEMLNEHVQNKESLEKFSDTIRQMLEDVEERLVFRANVYFQHDLSAYQPSPGDLAYPEKLEQMENLAIEIHENRVESRSSPISVESEEVAIINSNPLVQLRSHTGNSPADLHGMWYPTVKRTLVCLSRLYFCLDRQTFQGLAQEALAVCIQTIETAANLISNRKSVVDGKLFQIKHLLIIREQIAPFQVDFTVKEVSLDFSNVKNAAVSLINNRNKLFTFSSNNALLEFLLEGTPKVKEYLIDSRKEIDKHLKLSCETFISDVTKMLVGNIISWLQRADHVIKVSDAHSGNAIPLREQEFAKPQLIAEMLIIAQRNIKTKIPGIQRSMQLYLANRETEFILFRPIKNNVINTFIQLEQALRGGRYTVEDQLMIACPGAEQASVLICSVSLATEQDTFERTSNLRRSSQASSHQKPNAHAESALDVHSNDNLS